MESDSPEGRYVIHAGVVDGPHAASIVMGPYCSPVCAAGDVNRLVAMLAYVEEGSGVVTGKGGRLEGVVTTKGGRVWEVKLFADGESIDGD
ncbi:hypothetical protein [Streptomyces sp. NPDC014733]|uniref:hypothetical protein n=1 Tax=Streptomyces sp. NPDC014733 TaxID=3364885 RepID=UPI0036FDF713